MTSFKKKESGERVMTIRNVLKRLEKEQLNEDSPPINMSDVLRCLRYVVDHLDALDGELED